MSFGFLNALMLLGLAGLAIPPLIHLLNRRRFNVVDWGAMQFLQISETTRRRLLIEEILLMLLRMGLIGVMVLALAAPFAVSPLFAKMGSRANRDVVLVFDGSDSMNFNASGRSAHEAAQEWATTFVNGLAAGDGVAVLQAKQQVVPVLGEPTHDLERARDAIAHLPPPRGGADWPQALQAATQILAKSQRPQRDIILLGDGQRFGWADETTLLRWELLAGQRKEADTIRPRAWVVNLDPHRPADPPNWSLAPLKAGRAVASLGQQVTFHTALVLHGQTEYRPPYKLRLEIDGRPAGELPAPAAAPLEKGQVTWSFSHRFTAPGSHLVSVIVEPDPPPEQRGPGYAIKDQLPGDNRQDFALEVVKALPVLLVDGDARPNPKTRGSDFLRDALAPARDPAPAVLARVVGMGEFEPPLLERDLGKDLGSKPRVLVLANLPRLTPEQSDAVARFLAGGGGVLVALGDRAQERVYNEQLYREGQGWLPARLAELAGDEAAPDQAARPLPASFYHPALELFRDAPAGGLADARFPRWWKLTTPRRGAPAVPLALLSSNDALFVERPYRAGRVIVAAVPLDNSWRTNLTGLPAFVPLIHELVYYLAGARSAAFNLQPGQPIRYRPPGDEPPGPVTLHTPDGEERQIPAEHWPLVIETTRETGVYRLTGPHGAAWYAVQPDARESDLAPAAEAEHDKVAKLAPMQFENDPERLVASLAAPDTRQELWWWLMLGVIGLLCGEVWLTRRIALNR